MVSTEDGDYMVTLVIVSGDLIFVDENDKVLAIENWKTSLQRYMNYCEANGIEPQDLTAFH
ncbi:hypothetical protein D9M72_480290 [compost metagenome]